jgi:hypothetical protein
MGLKDERRDEMEVWEVSRGALLEVFLSSSLLPFLEQES